MTPKIVILLGTILSLQLLLIAATHSSSPETFNSQDTLYYAVRQYTKLSLSLSGKDGFIHAGNPLSPEWSPLVGVSWWTAGFYGGSLWMLFKLTGDAYWKTLALEYQDRVKSWQFKTDNHDIGFVIMSTFGLALEYDPDLTPEMKREFEEVIHQSAKSLATRYSPVVNCTRSWNSANEFTVIIDNMMNLELLFRAHEITGNQTFLDIALRHSHRTIEEHFRPDGGCYHVVGYNETTGAAVRKYTSQGYSDNSTWSRGLAWATHGYITVFEKSRYSRFLEIAQRSAKYFLERVPPEDYVAHWDFDAPRGQGQYQPRDTSAAAIMAHALLKIYVATAYQEKYYLEAAVKMMEGLEKNYRADVKPEYKIPALLVNATVFFNNGEFDSALVYADFYYLRALDLYMEIPEM